MIIRGGPTDRNHCYKDSIKDCWNPYYKVYECKTPEPIVVKCSQEAHNIPAFEHKTVWGCDKCGKLYIFRVTSNRFAVNGFIAEWNVKQFQRLMFWEKKC